jgi:hypothetical protein
MAFPSKGDRVAHGDYGPGTITEQDIYHTLIDFDTHGLRRFVTSKVVLERTSVPSPTAAERRSAAAAARPKTPKVKKTAKTTAKATAPTSS